jgi:hypothetical protein
MIQILMSSSQSLLVKNPHLENVFNEEDLSKKDFDHHNDQDSDNESNHDEIVFEEDDIYCKRCE